MGGENMTDRFRDPLHDGPGLVSYEVRHGRNFIRHGDLVRIRPSSPGQRDGFTALFKYADSDKGGLYYAVVQLPDRRWRFVRPDRVRRKAVATLRRKGVR
jgi:hypothetical protein